MRIAKTIAGLGVFVALACLAQQPYHNSLTWRANQWHSGASPSAVFVAVASLTNKCVWSPDATNWYSATMPQNIDWRSVAYGNGVFVAVAGGAADAYASSVAAVSSDGKTWTQTAMPSASRWWNVAYVGGKFLACGTTNVAVSTNGSSWYKTTFPAGSAWQYSGQLNNTNFVLISDDFTKKSCNSADGVNWDAGGDNLPRNAYWHGCASDGTKLLTLANNQQYVAVSANGTNWAQITIGGPYQWYSCAYGSNSGKWVAVANDPYIAWSADATNWNNGTPTPPVGWLAVCYGNNLYVAAGFPQIGDYMTNIVITSYDGASWGVRNLPVKGSWTGITASTADRSP